MATTYIVQPDQEALADGDKLITKTAPVDSSIRVNDLLKEIIECETEINQLTARHNMLIDELTALKTSTGLSFTEPTKLETASKT